MPANLEAIIASVAHAGAMEARVEGLVAEVVWQDRQPAEKAEPRAFVLFQDPKLFGGASITSVSEQVSAFAGVCFADLDNEGGLVAVASGAWDQDVGSQHATPVDLDLEVVKTGSLYDSGEWAWRFNDDDADQFRGMDDLRWMHDTHRPFDALGASSCMTVCWSKAFNRIILGAHPTGSTDLRWVYRSTSVADPTAWSGVQTRTFTPDRSPALSNGYSSMWELPDGALRWAYTYASPSGASTRDMDILGSTDGGVTWDVVKEKVITDIFGGPQQVSWFRVVQSGAWSRMELWNNSTTPAGRLSAASADRGATWGLAGGVTTPDGLDNTGSNSDTANRYETQDICAVDDSGTFLRVRTVNTGAKLYFELASRDGAWSRISATESALFSATDADCVNVYCASGGGRAWVLVFRSDHHTGGPAVYLDYWSEASFIIPLDRLVEGWNSTSSPRIGQWARWGADDWLSYAGASRWHPKGGQLVWSGAELAFFRGLVDRQTSTGTAGWKDPVASYFGGPSRRPLRLPQQTNTDLMERFAWLDWTADMGPPIGASASAGTPWASVGTGSVSTADPEKTELTVTPGQNLYFRQFQALAAVTMFAADAGVIWWSTRAQPGSIPSAGAPAQPSDSPQWGAVLRSESNITAGLTVMLRVHVYGDGGLALTEAGPSPAGTTLYEAPAGTLAGITSGTWYDFRLMSAHSDNLGRIGTNLFAELSWSKAGDNAWATSGLITTNASAVNGGADQSFAYGSVLSTVGNSITQWRQAGARADGLLSQGNLLNPLNMRGFDVVPWPQRMGQGVNVVWGGAGGFSGDGFVAPISYEYGAEQVLGDSPSSIWRSATAQTQTMVFDSLALDGGLNERFLHSGAAIVNTNSRYVWMEYAADSTFANASFELIDGTRYTATVGTVYDDASFSVSGGTWKDGELVGTYMRARPTVSVPNPPIVKVGGNAGAWIHSSATTMALAAYGFEAGNKVDFWGTQHVRPYYDHPDGLRVISSGGTLDGSFPRYLRVTIPGAARQGSPPEDYWFMGRVHAGLTLPFTVPMTWDTQDDSESPIQDIQTMNSGSRAVYQQGSPRRTVGGTVMGDIDRWRVGFRAMVRALSGYALRPVVVSTDVDQPNTASLYSRYMGATEFANAGWRYDSTAGRYVQVGDLKVSFEEEV